jgi:DNA repair protein REV1
MGDYTHHDGNFGVYMAQKISKLQNEQNDSQTINIISNILAGCVIFVNGYTDPPIEELRRLVTLHGGKFNAYHVNNTTHFVCNHFTDAQVKLLFNRQTGAKNKLSYVTSAWLLSSIAAGQRLPEANFLPAELRGQHGALLSRFFPTATHETTAHSSSSSSSSHSTSSSANISQKAPLKQILATKIASGSSSGLSSPVKASASCTAGKSSHLLNNTEDNPDFIQQYFGRSRLHFIGTWRSRLPLMVAEFGGDQSNGNINSSPKKSLNPFLIASRAVSSNLKASSSTATNSRVVIHIDMDCFFVSALIRDDPVLRAGNIPIAVAHSSSGGTSEISSCNYPARAKGLTSGMFMSEALYLCPELIVLAYNFPLYEEISKEIYRIFYSLPDCIVEAVSVDEAYLEFPSSVNGEEKATQLRQLIYETTKCSASAGISYNMLLARLATRKAKPNGQYFISSATMAKELLRSMKLADLPGVGYRLNKKLLEQGLQSCGQLWEYSADQLKNLFGDASGQLLWNSSRGIDHTALTPVQARRSIGAEVNWGLRFTDLPNAIVFIGKLSEEVARRLSEAGLQGRSLVMKIKKRKADAAVDPVKFLGHGRVDNISKSMTSSRDLSSAAEIAAAAVPLFQQILAQHQVIVNDLRGMGIQINKLSRITTTATAATTFSVGLIASSSSSSLVDEQPSITANKDELPIVMDDDAIDYEEEDQTIARADHSNSRQQQDNSMDDDVGVDLVSMSHDIDSVAMRNKEHPQRSSKEEDEDVFKLSRSQEDFLSNIPIEMHSEVIESFRAQKHSSKQIPAHPADDREASSSSSSDAMKETRTIPPRTIKSSSSLQSQSQSRKVSRLPSRSHHYELHCQNYCRNNASLYQRRMQHQCDRMLVAYPLDQHHHPSGSNSCSRVRGVIGHTAVPAAIRRANQFYMPMAVAMMSSRSSWRLTRRATVAIPMRATTRIPLLTIKG